MNNENESTDNVTADNSASEQSDKLQKISTLKKVALPASVIFMSCFCGIIACGATCSFVSSPVHVLGSSSSSNIRMAAWVWGIVSMALGAMAGLYVGKDVIRRYRTDQERKDQT